MTGVLLVSPQPAARTQKLRLCRPASLHTGSSCGHVDLCAICMSALFKSSEIVMYVILVQSLDLWMYVSPLLLYVSANLSICVSENSPRLVARSVVSRKLSVKLTKQGIRGRTGGVGGGVVRGRRRAPRERERDTNCCLSFSLQILSTGGEEPL